MIDFNRIITAFIGKRASEVLLYHWALEEDLQIAYTDSFLRTIRWYEKKYGNKYGKKYFRFFDDSDIEIRIALLSLMDQEPDFELIIEPIFKNLSDTPAKIILNFIYRMRKEMWEIRKYDEVLLPTKNIEYIMSYEIDHWRQILESRKDWEERFMIPPLSPKNKIKIDWSSKIKEEIEKLPFGQVLFNITKLMKIGKKERIELRIIQGLTKEITENLKGRGIAEIEVVKIGDFMKVRLSGDHFKINALNEEEQVIAEDNYTEWAWDVVPLKSKIQVLHFHVTIRLKIEGSEEKRDYPVIDKEVFVKVNPIYSTKVFAVNNWKWILTALIIPLGLWIVRMVLVRGK